MGTVHSLRAAPGTPRDLLESALNEDLESVVILKCTQDGDLTASWSECDMGTLSLYARLFDMRLDQYIKDEVGVEE